MTNTHVTIDSDKAYMWEALNEAGQAFAEDEVPVGAIAVVHDKIIARAHNIREKTSDPLGHAEILLLQKMAAVHGDWRFEEVTVYVTCEPCLMCAGALIQSRIARLVYGCLDPKAGACGSLYSVTEDERLNHRIETIGGVLEKECGALLTDFFRKKRLAR